MVDTISELSSLASRLNENSNTLNSAITSINEKLRELNFGLEVWLDQSWIEIDDWETTNENGKPIDPKVVATILGYCEVEGAWQLATKKVTLHKRKRTNGDYYYEPTDPSCAKPLLKQTRSVRIRAAADIPNLLDELRDQAVDLMECINSAKQVAAKLGGTDLARLLRQPEPGLSGPPPKPAVKSNGDSSDDGVNAELHVAAELNMEAVRAVAAASEEEGGPIEVKNLGMAAVPSLARMRRKNSPK